MTRYFSALLSAGPLEVGGRSFTFERIEPSGGSWLGVLAVDDPVSASILADAGYEISAEEYDRRKKKVTARTGHDFGRSPTPPPQRLTNSAARAAQSGSTGDSPASAPISNGAAEPAPAQVLASVSLLTTTERPPAEPLLTEDDVKTLRRKAA